MIALRRGNPFSIAPIAIVVVVCLVFAVQLRSPGSGSGNTADAVALVADGPRFSSLDALAGAIDRIVVGEVVALERGRAITDPSDPRNGVRTQVVTLRVDRVLGGEPAATVTIEQEASLLDGTPVTVNGAPPLAIGDVGVAFILDGTTEAFPHAALVNEQGWIPVVDGIVDVAAADAVTGVPPGGSVDALAAALADGGTT
jgi:hypothetical protein